MSVRVHQDLVRLFAWAEKRQPSRGPLNEGTRAFLIEIRKIVSKPGGALLDHSCC